MDYVSYHYFDNLFCSKVDPEKLKEYAKRKATEELAKLLMEKAEVETTPWNNGIVVKISFLKGEEGRPKIYAVDFDGTLEL